MIDRMASHYRRKKGVNLIAIISAWFLLANPIFIHAQSLNEKSVTVYYFHRSMRCHACLLLEELTLQAVTSGYQDELGQNKIRIRVINLDETQNAHFEDRYHLTSQAVVLSQTTEGREDRWNRLDKAWELLPDEPKLIEYIQKQIALYLKD